MALLVEEVHVVILAVVANLFHHRPHAGLVVANELGVFELLALEVFHESLLFGEGTFKFRDAGS